MSHPPVCPCWVSVAVSCQAFRVTALDQPRQPCQLCQPCPPPWQAFWDKSYAKAERSHLARRVRANIRVSCDSRVSRVRAKRRVSRAMPAVSCARAGSSCRVLAEGAVQTCVVSDRSILVVCYQLLGVHSARPQGGQEIPEGDRCTLELDDTL